MLKFVIGFSLCLTGCSSTRITYEIGEEINLGTTVKVAPKTPPPVKRGRGLVGNYGDTYSLWDALFAEPSTKL